jgi:type IV pilus assembly protein PilY1
MSKIKSFALGVLLAGYAAAPAWALNIADVPLFQSTTVAPNVMLLVDNSGSMNNIIHPEGVLLSSYPAVAYKDSNGNYVFTSLTNGNIFISALQPDSCASGYKALWSVVDGSVATKRCYLFPDPVGSGNTRYTGKYLAYIFNTFTAANNDLTAESDSAVPKTFRIQVARDSAKGIALANRAMRIGLAKFNPPTNANSGPGGSIVQEVKNLSSVAGVTQAVADQNYSDIVASIDALTSEANTPLAESYYEVSRYFRGLGRDQGSGTGNYTSPIQYRCQKNFGIVLTDGLPTHDRSFPADDPGRDNASVAGDNNLPNWDGLQTAFGDPYSDGEAPDDINSNGEGSTLYLDDIAKFAFDIDLRSSGSDLASVSFNDPDFLKQNMITYAVGFAVDNQMLRDTAEYGHGEYYAASNAAQLNEALSRALQSIKERTSSAAAIATNSTRLDTDTLIYQAKFNSGDWSGELIAYGINTDGSVGTARWRTGTSGLIPSPLARNVFTRNASAGVAFQWDNLSAAQQAALSNNATDGAVVVNWLRGGSSGATLSSASSPVPNEVLRTRTTVLGDIVNSDPVFVGAQSYGYTVPNDIQVANEPADTYQAYVDAKAAAVKTVMVGGNDGMLHSFNAETGSELFAYVPSSLYAARAGNPGATPGLRYLTKSTYSHKYYVDGSIGVGDVYDSTWKTYAVGGLGAGGRGIYALNITTPASFSASNVLWEITAPDTNTTSNDWNDLGYTYGAPIIVRTQDSSNPWVAIFSNGYGSNTGGAALYVVNATTGALVKKIVVDTDLIADVDNGLSPPSAIVDANRKLTAVYAGDLKGNLWKFDFSSTSASSWDVAYTSGNNASRVSVPLFIAKNAAGQAQPITSGLEVGSHPISGLMIYFGTGKYFETSDNTVGNSPQKQSFYGIWDKTGNSNATNTSGGPITSTDRSLLRRQTITTEVNAGGNDYRVVSTDPITTANWSGLRGWYLDLVPPSGIAAGERAVSLPLLRAGRIIFTTVIPSADPCLAGGTSWLMELDAFTGGNLNYAVLDTNGDGEFNNADKVACGDGLLCYPAGLRSREGIIKTPGIVSAGDTEYKYSGGSSGNILVITEKGSLKEGRMSWRQLR